MNTLITLVVSTIMYTGGGIGSTSDKSISTFSIPGFKTVVACEEAKNQQVSRLMELGVREGRIKADCYSYGTGE